MTVTEVAPARITAGSPELRRLQAAMVCAGLAAFALLYATQALLPQIAATFSVGATVASLTVAVTTGALAILVVPLSGLAERTGRLRLMTVGLAVACVAVAAGAAAPDLAVLLIARGVDGAALACVVAVAVGHLGAEVHESASAAAIGVYVSGTTVGGLTGRLLTAGVGGAVGWRWALVALAGLGALCLLLFVRLVPPGRVSVERAPAAVRRHLHDRGVIGLCLVGLLLMGGFVATYNFLTFRLGEAPFRLSTSVIGLVFLAYLAGTVSSTTAARLTDRLGRRGVVLGSIVLAVAGLLLTLAHRLPLVIVGLVIFTFGFFGAHAVASGWVAGRARGDTSQASALYLSSYYLGSSIGGTVIGLAFAAGGWPATVATVGLCYAAAAVIASTVREPAVRAPAVTT